MEVTVKKDLKFKSGDVIREGETVKVVVDKDRPTVAILRYNDVKYATASANLHVISEKFVKPTEEELMRGTLDSVCSSLLGNDVEPDGWDEYGFPSVLLAMGMI
jgi:hypothetical protein